MQAIPYRPEARAAKFAESRYRGAQKILKLLARSNAVWAGAQATQHLVAVKGL